MASAAGSPEEKAEYKKIQDDCRKACRAFNDGLKNLNALPADCNGKQMKRKSRDARDDAWEPQPSALRERSAGRRAVEAVDCVVVAEVKAGGAWDVERR